LKENNGIIEQILFVNRNPSDLNEKLTFGKNLI